MGDKLLMNAKHHHGHRFQFAVAVTIALFLLATRRRPADKPTEMVAVRAPAGEGALPPRNPLPVLHKVPDNGLARTPPMGWNSWNKFASRVDDATVRSIADAMAGNGMKEAGYLYINIDDTW